MTATMQRFKVKAGIHFEPRKDFEERRSPEGKILNLHDKHRKFDTGEIVESDRDLEMEFPLKFERVMEEIPKEVTEARRVAVQQLISTGVCDESDREMLEQLKEDNFQRISRIVEKKALAGDTKPSSVLGEDVTHQFQRAYDEGFRVWKAPSGKFQVTKGDPSKPLNTNLLEQSKVEKFVENYLKEVR